MLSQAHNAGTQPALMLDRNRDVVFSSLSLSMIYAHPATPARIYPHNVQVSV